MKSPNNNNIKHLYKDAYIAPPTAVIKAAIEIKNGHGLADTRWYGCCALSVFIGT